MRIAPLLALMLLPASAQQVGSTGQQAVLAPAPAIDQVRQHVVKNWAKNYAPRLAHCEAREGEAPQFVSVDKLDCGPARPVFGDPDKSYSYKCRFEIAGRFADGSERRRPTAESFQWEKDGSLFALAVIPPASPELAKCPLFRS